MSQNITLLGASYTDVPSVQLPKTGGGMASFDDTTDADAVASDIAQGKTAYVNGVKLVGTGSGGSGPKVETGTITISSNTRTIAFNHSLGVVPKVCSILHDDIDTAPSDSRYIGAVGAYTGVEKLYLTSSAYVTNGVLSVMINQDSSGKVTRQAPTSASYGATTWNNTKVEFISGSTSTRWKLGTYTYIVEA